MGGEGESIYKHNDSTECDRFQKLMEKCNVKVADYTFCADQTNTLRRVIFFFKDIILFLRTGEVSSR